MDLQPLLEEHGAASWDKQMCLADLIGDGGWQLSVSQGQITFGGRQTFPVQILGSESEAAGTWLWSWANNGISPPEAALQGVNQLREFGDRNSVPQFVEPELSLDAANGHLLSMIASGLCRADAYYRGPYEGGAVFLLLNAPQVRQYSDDSPLRFIRIFNEFISAFACSHRAAFAAYARYKGYPTDTQGDAVITALPAGAQVRAVFDPLDRLIEMTSTLTQENIGAKPEKKPWWKLKG